MRTLLTLPRFLLAWCFTLSYSALCCVVSLLASPSRAWIWMARTWARVTLWLLGVHCEVLGAERLRGPAIFVCNHQSLLDVVIMPAVLPHTVRFVGKRSLLWVPFWGWFFGMGGSILIDRSNPRTAVASMRRGLQRLTPGWSLMIFPEGTRSPNGELQAFRSGALRMALSTKLPIVPVALDGARDISPPDGWLVRPGRVRVVVGEPMDTADWNPRRVEENFDRVHAAVNACLERASGAAARRRDVAV